MPERQAHQVGLSGEPGPPGSSLPEVGPPGSFSEGDSEETDSTVLDWYEEMTNRSRPFAERSRLRPPDSRRVQINVHPTTKRRLTTFLVFGPGREVGVGFSEFIEQSLRLWLEMEPVPCSESRSSEPSPAEVSHERLLNGEPLLE